ncbi:MAG: FliI/YscN family ATPase [Myxococcota bacterium]
MSLAQIAAAAATPIRRGRLVEAVGLALRAEGLNAAIGQRLIIRGAHGDTAAEVVGVRDGSTLMMPLGSTSGLQIGAPVESAPGGNRVPVGEALLGRVIDGLGRPLDGLGPIVAERDVPLRGAPAHPLMRRPVTQVLTTGVPVVDAVLTLGRGQRIGIFAGGGVGKSTLLARLVEGADCDVCVVALIGERGREVEEWVHRTLGAEGLARSVVVAATSADPPLLRARGALHATALAEGFRDAGKRVLLVMDSVTRYAMALREVGLAAGEPPATKGYTPSVFAALPHLLERAGTGTGQGSITGVYTVLVEGDELSDPIADAARAILDGHIVLSRRLAERDHYPAIDVRASISRVMAHIVSNEQDQDARQARRLLADAEEAEELRSLGAYRPGEREDLDEALARKSALNALLCAPRVDDAADALATVVRGALPESGTQ